MNRPGGSPLSWEAFGPLVRFWDVGQRFNYDGGGQASATTTNAARSMEALTVPTREGS